ncbi:MAG: hypothetical protein AB8H86_20060 [Polyangiales bacterium]
MLDKRKALRFAAAEIRAEELREEGVVLWAKEAKASSEYSASYGAEWACGAPRVFPKGGDEDRTWLAESSDDAPWLEVTFEAATGANALVICETCGAGAAYEVRDVDSDEVLYSAEPVAFADSRRPHLLYVPLEVTPRRVRISVAPRDFESEYKEIDAVGLVVGSLPSVEALAEDTRKFTHRRYKAKREPFHSLKKDRRLIFATHAGASGEYSSSYSAKKATGRPKVYPKGGDYSNTWVAEQNDEPAWITLNFKVPQNELVYAVAVFETCGAGATTRIEDDEDRVLWRGRPEPVPRHQARLLVADIGPRWLNQITLFQSPADDYRQIDAVALVTAPMEEMSEPPPPPGTPRGGWTRVEGTLDVELAHVTTCGFDAARAVNTGGPATLTTSAGERVSLQLDEATFYGALPSKLEGRVAELKRDASLAPALEGFKDSDDVVVRRRVFEASSQVVVLGTPTNTSGRGGGFRDADRVSGALEVSAMAPPEQSSLLEEHHPKSFKAEAKRLQKPTPHPHLRHVKRRVAIGITLALGALGAWHELFPNVACALGSIAAYLWINAFDSAWRMRAIPFFQQSVTQNDMGRRTFWGRWTEASLLGTSGAVFTAVTLALGLFVVVPVSAASISAEDTVEALHVGKGSLAALGLFASMLLLLWLWRDFRTMRKACRVLMRPKWKGGTTTQPVRVTGRLRGEYTRSERFDFKSKHVGTYSETLENGNTVQRDQYENWTERHTAAIGPKQIQLCLPDERVLEAPGRQTATTDLGLKPVKTHDKSNLVSLTSEHKEGDEATLVGVVVDEGGTLKIESKEQRVLVLGTLGELRRRIALQLVFVATLILTVVAALLTVLR